MSEVFKENENPLLHWLDNVVEKTHYTAKEKFIPIPRLKVTDEGVVEYGFVDFDLDLSEFNHLPIKNNIIIQNLEDLSDLQRIEMCIRDRLYSHTRMKKTERSRTY